MPNEFDVLRTEFDLDTFQQILEAMDGYYVLPTAQSTGSSKKTVEPWDLPEMPDVSLDSWRYHIGIAIDRGFVACWTPQQTVEHIDSLGNRSQSTTIYDNDPKVTSLLRPARLTYAGKEFIDNLRNPSVKEQAATALKRWGLPFVIHMVTEAATNGLLG